MAHSQGSKRYEHFLAAAKPSPWPDAVLTVGCDVRWDRIDGDKRREKMHLEGWHATLLVRHGSGYAVARTMNGRSAETWWGAIESLTVRSKRPMVLSSRFRVDAAALGLWQQMENGNVRISGKETRIPTAGHDDVSNLRPEGENIRGQTPSEVSAGGLSGMPGLLDSTAPTHPPSGRRRRKQSGGICVLEDPPIVLQLRIGVGGVEFTWLDAVNYGVQLVAEGSTGETLSRAAADWFHRASATLATLSNCGWQATAGSQAMHLFRCSFLDCPMLSHTHPDAERLESRALFGGRCEPFVLGRVDCGVHLYDVRSLYPSIMASAELPERLALHDGHLDVDRLRRLCEQYCCIADVAIQTDEADYPYRRGVETIWPVGRFWSVLTGAELQHALAAGVVRGVRQASAYKTGRTLSRYAETLYAERCRADKEGDVHRSMYIKRLMVALAGKFAQRIASWQDMPNAECPWDWGEWYSMSPSGEPQRWRVIAGRIQLERREGFSHGAIPAITAAICAAGRMRLLDCIHAAGRESVLYCDTDAIIVDDYGSESVTLAGLVRPGEWGYLQHVISADNAEIHGVKRYRIGNRVREAGRTCGNATGDTRDSEPLRQPWIGESLRKQSAPADWRERHPYQRGPGRYTASREAGGSVRPIEIMEW